MKAQVVKPLKLLGITGLIGEVGLMLYVVLVAYMHPTKSVIININRFGEALGDIAVLLLVIILGLYVLYHEIRGA